MPFPILVPSSLTDLVEDMQIELLVCWCGTPETQHTTSGSNEEDTGTVVVEKTHIKKIQNVIYLTYVGIKNVSTTVEDRTIKLLHSILKSPGGFTHGVQYATEIAMALSQRPLEY